MVQGYIVKKDTCAAVGEALAQPVNTHGAGGGMQYFIPEYKSALQPAYTMILTKP